MTRNLCRHCSARPSPSRPLAAGPLDRRRCRVPLRWRSEGTAPALGATEDLSVHGMFVVTGEPAQPGSAVRVEVDLAGRPQELHGVVIWSRPHSEPDLPSGMGIRLIHPPPSYADFVVALG
jgi:uncharacterized protein (TIGR02266 family)